MNEKTYAELGQIILKNTSAPPCVIDDIIAQIQIEINDTLTGNNPHYKNPTEVLNDYTIPHKYITAFLSLDNPF